MRDRNEAPTLMPGESALPFIENAYFALITDVIPIYWAKFEKKADGFLYLPLVPIGFCVRSMPFPLEPMLPLVSSHSWFAPDLASSAPHPPRPDIPQLKIATSYYAE